MNMDITGSVWEDDTRSNGNGRFILVISAESQTYISSILKVEIIEIDNNSFYIEQLDFDFVSNNFPHLPFKRIS